MRKRTDELFQLLQADLPLETYLEENREELLELTLSEFLHRLLEEYHTAKNEVIRRSGLNQIYGYQIFAGTKSPSRDKLLALAFGFPLSLQDTQRLLRLAGHSELYPRSRRDSILLFGLKHQLTVPEMDDLLFDQQEATLL